MRRRSWFVSVLLSALLLSACGDGGGGGGQGQSSGTTDSGGGDQSLEFVRQMSATAPETAVPEDLAEMVTNTPENADPAN